MTDVSPNPPTPPNPAPNPAPNPSPNPAPAWHEGKVAAETVGFWQNKGYDIADPVNVATKLTEQYRNAERLIGAPPEEMIRLPKPNAAEADIRQYLTRIGVPAEAKDYDLSAVKFSNGTALDQGYSDSIRALLLAARVPSDRAAGLASGLVKIDEAKASAAAAELTTAIQAEQQRLDKNWGTNKPYNMAIAKTALERVGAASGLNAEQIKAGWDALSKVGGIGSSYAMEMLFAIGSRMGEAPFIGPNNNTPPGGPMSREAAKAEIESLKKDRDWFLRWQRGDAAERRRWDNLHKIAFGEAA